MIVISTCRIRLLRFACRHVTLRASALPQGLLLGQSQSNPLQLTRHDSDLQQVPSLGPLSGLVGMLPGVPKEVRDVEIDDREIGRVEASIRSVTAKPPKM